MRCTNRSLGATNENYYVVVRYVPSAERLGAEADKGGASMRIGARAERALTGLSWGVASIKTFSFMSSAQRNLIMGHDAPIFKIGLPISFLVMVRCLVGIDG